MHPRLIELTGFLDAERAHLLAAASALPAAQWGTRPSPDRWSVAEILWHLHRTEANIAGLISTRVAAARAGAYEPETNESSVINSLDKIPITDRTRRLTSPRSITPTENQENIGS